jgi:hypothetical protein
MATVFKLLSMKRPSSRTFYAFALFIVLSASRISAQHHSQADKPAVHGMVIFGTEKIYAYHLPMFDAPHNYQVLLELQFDKEVTINLKRDQQLNPEHSTYTIEPETFVLPDMIQSPRPFKANIYRGHFERGGVKIFNDVNVKIVEVLYFNYLDPIADKAETLQYLVVGNHKEQFAAHLLTNKPDFDQLVQINIDHTLLKDVKVLKVNFPSSENNVPGIAGNAVNGFLTDRPVKLIFLRQLYLEFDDLR